MPSTLDLWDVSQGTVVVADSGIRDGFLADGMFGAGPVLEEYGNTIFADGQPAGSVHFIEWRTPAPVTLQAFRLFASGDGPYYGNERDFAQFVLKAKSPNSSEETVTDRSSKRSTAVMATPEITSSLPASVTMPAIHGFGCPLQQTLGCVLYSG